MNLKSREMYFIIYVGRILGSTYLIGYSFTSSLCV